MDPVSMIAFYMALLLARSLYFIVSYPLYNTYCEDLQGAH